MSIPLRWAAGDRAVVRVEVRHVGGVDHTGADGAVVRIPLGRAMLLPISALEIAPLVVDDPRVVELVAAARAYLRHKDEGLTPRLEAALAAIPSTETGKPR